MSDSTPRLGLPDLPDTPELYADTVADAFWRLDALSDLCLKGELVNTPPSSPADGDAYLVGGAPTGAWSGYAYKIASCRDGGWQMLTPCNGLRAWVADSARFIVYQDGIWTDWNSLIGAGEAAIASAATCDIGAAGSLFLQVMGTTAITAFGTTANALRFLRFAASLTLTHNATSLILPGSANIVTAAGDVAIFASDSSGNWRCRQYSRASGLPVSLASPTVTGTLTAAAANFSGTVTGADSGSWSSGGLNGISKIGIGMTPANLLDVAAANPVIGMTATGTSTGYGTKWLNGGNEYASDLMNLSTGEFRHSVGRSAFGGFHTWYADGSARARLANDGSFLVGTVIATGAGTIATQVYTVTTLPAGAKGARAFVSDANASTFNAAAAGGGPNNVPVFHDGSGWRIG